MLENTKKTVKKVRENGRIMGINVNSTTVSSVLARVEDLVSHSQKFYIVTPNPELILMAQTDKNLANALNGATISVPDGVGLKVAVPSLQIIKGRELFGELIKLSNKNHWKVFLLGGLGEEAKLAKLKIENSMKNENCALKIESAKGPTLDKEGNPVSENDGRLEKEAIVQINEFRPQLLFVAFGNPKQEIWIEKNLSRLNVGGAMAVGGTFRYIAGNSKVPPKWMSQAGLEWLWRGLTEPMRIGRIFRAVIIFPLKVFQSKLLK